MSIRPMRGMALGLTAALLTAGALTAAAGTASADARWGCGGACSPGNITFVNTETVVVNHFVDDDDWNNGKWGHKGHHHHCWGDDDDSDGGHNFNNSGVMAQIQQGGLDLL